MATKGNCGGTNSPEYSAITDKWGDAGCGYYPPGVQTPRRPIKTPGNYSFRHNPLSNDADLEVAGCALTVVGSLMQLAAVMIFVYSDW